MYFEGDRRKDFSSLVGEKERHYCKVIGPVKRDIASGGVGGDSLVIFNAFSSIVVED